MSLVCYYTCTLTPPGLLGRTGVMPRALLDYLGEGGRCAPPAAAPAILPHSNTCPYVVRTLAAAEAALGADATALLAVPSGCDAMRRAGDALKARYHDRVFPYLVPRTNDPGSVDALTRELDRLGAWREGSVAEERAGSGEAAAGPLLRHRLLQPRHE